MPIPKLKNSDFWRQKPGEREPFSKKLKDHPVGRWFWRHRRKFLAIFLILASLMAIFGVITFIILSRDLPNPNQLLNREVAQTTRIYDRTGQHVLYEIHGDQKRTLVTLDQIPVYTQKATIAIEDKDFYKHGGFSLWAMFRTAVTDVLFNRSAGGSTLTQQFVKNAILTSEKSITRKVKEIILAERIEQKFNKDQILQMYLNEIPYGSNAYGVEAASEKYFGKSVKDIDLAESATLAAMIQSPSRYSPYGSNLNILLSRKDYVLDLMEEQGYITKDQRDAAKKENLNFQKQETNIFAPHFVMYVKNLLAEKYGEKTMEQGGLKVYTTLDYDKQQIAQQVVAEKTVNYEKNYRANNAALVAIDPKTGQVLAMVGSRDYFNDEINGQVNIATSLRQPGSSIKPIVYAALFEKGYTPNTILYDVLTNFSTDSANPYIPKNYNLKEYGPVTIRQALAGSLNIPVVKALYLAGVKNVISLAQTMGYSSPGDSDRFGLSLVLGGAEVQLLEHTNAYSAFARDGQVSQVTAILKVEDKDGKTLEDNSQPQSKQVITSKTARLINSILTDNSARAFIFGNKNYLTLNNRPVGAKTGTTNDYHDAWAVGYTPSLVAGVWVGNTDNKAMVSGADGSVVAAPIWNAFMRQALGNTPIENFKAPDSFSTGKGVLDGSLKIIGTTKIDKRTNLPASSNTPAEFIQSKDIYNNHCILYYVDKDNPLGPAPSDPSADPQFAQWESAVQAWAKKTGQISGASSPFFQAATSTESIIPSGNASSSIPVASSTEAATGTSSAAATTTAPSEQPAKEEQPQPLSFKSPLKGQVVSGDTMKVEVDTGNMAISTVSFYLDHKLFGILNEEPLVIQKSLKSLSNGYHYLSAQACDASGKCIKNGFDINIMK